MESYTNFFLEVLDDVLIRFFSVLYFSIRNNSFLHIFEYKTVLVHNI